MNDEFDMKRMGSILKRARIKKGLKQEALAEDVEIGLKQLQDVENGKTLPSFLLYYRLTKRLDVSSDYIFGIAEFKSERLSTYYELEQHSDKQINIVREVLEQFPIDEDEEE